MTGPTALPLTVRLEELPFFQGFGPEFFERIRPHATERQYEAGDEVVREGAPAEEFFLIVQGKVGLEAVSPERPRRTIQTVGPGEVLGWSWLTPPRRWLLDARALKPTRAVVLAGAPLLATLEADPATGLRFLLRLLPVIAQRLENTRLQLLDIHGP